MANFIPFFRSSYYQVKDPAAFETFCKKWDVRMVRGGENDALFGFLGADDVGLPLSYFDAEKDEFVEGDFIADLAPHLADGWVAIVREIGFEKLRYLVGYTIAVNSAGRCISVNLDEIYRKAKRLGPNSTSCEY